ncbi:MAG: DNA repair helicase XPB [Sphaerochaetaceae bacterium]
MVHGQGTPTMKDTPLIVQSDRTLLLDVHHPQAEACRKDLVRFSSLVKSPEHVHTYRLDEISLWNAVSLGCSVDWILSTLDEWSRYPVPETVTFFVSDMAGRFGKIVMEETDDPLHYRLSVKMDRIAKEIAASKSLAKILSPCDGANFLLEKYQRGEAKLLLVKLGYPVDDRIRLTDGFPVPMRLRDVCLRTGKPFSIRDYQKEATDALLGDGQGGSGFGIIVLPCGSGKTIVGMEIMARLSTRTLVLTTNVAAVHQWIDEIKDKMEVPDNAIGEYTGEKKETRPITVCTYQVLTYRPDKEGPYPHMELLTKGGWGLVIYDEVHMLPAPVFKVTAELQAVHRVGLTATLVREDGREDEVFSLVGPKRYDRPWGELQAKGYIAEAFCHEIRIDLPEELEVPYAIAEKRQKYRIASENPRKIDVVKNLVTDNPDDFILIIGQYLEQLEAIQKALGAPIITGSTPTKEREALYKEFKEGKKRVLVVSKVANFAIDLPDASMAIQVSGTFGSRSEEAQRLGRILRPKERSSRFYTLVTRFSCEEEFSANRQKFLSEQGYRYDISVWGKA